MNKDLQKLVKDPFLNWLLVIACATVIFTYSSMTVPELKQGEISSKAVCIPDWAMHFAEYFIFGILLYRALHVSGFKKAALLAITIAFAYAISDEIHQFFVPGRIFSIKDIISDSLGVITAQIVSLKKLFLK